MTKLRGIFFDTLITGKFKNEFEGREIKINIDYLRGFWIIYFYHYFMNLKVPLCL